MLVSSILSILSSLLSILFLSRKEIALMLIAVQKQKEILERKLAMRNERIRFGRTEKAFISILSALSGKARAAISLIKPETVLRWYQNLIKKRWTFTSNTKPVGRPPVSAEIKQLILTMKNDNLHMRTGKIQGELLKLGFPLSISTIRRILRDFRKQGKIRKSLTWKKFIESHLRSLFAMDFFTVDSLFGERLYVFFIILINTREIVQFGITDIPSRDFVRNQLFGFVEDRSEIKPYLIHDRTGEFLFQNYGNLGIKNIPTSPESPNMNAYAERFVGSIRREALDSFIIVNRSQLYSIVKQYVDYYNTMRPHQGIGQNIPKGYQPRSSGIVVSKPILSGLWHHYFRVAA